MLQWRGADPLPIIPMAAKRSEWQHGAYQHASQPAAKQHAFHIQCATAAACRKVSANSTQTSYPLYCELAFSVTNGGPIGRTTLSRPSYRPSHRSLGPGGAIHGEGGQYRQPERHQRFQKHSNLLSRLPRPSQTGTAISCLHQCAGL